ncbi:hypothetical protein CWE15_06540 [Aliidiomarina taiwanensis]|uniref:DUF2802 domain-containing protein n=1 Tax=Aliidiomarina taiwanensis TaxID=946228 RepID=A0A432X878_9GAMM|nr:DUF2802 domain-containing protein [Aliidiomarina taiwanensis]RUO43055.1 hypothetical protein CWE15_06540 [Aliidiomarina taiwanensis]
MNELILFWLPFSLSSAALVGVLVVLIATLRSRDDQTKLLQLFEKIRGEGVSASQLQALADELDQLKLEQAQFNGTLEQQLQRRVAEAQTQLEQQQANFAEHVKQQLSEQQNAIQEVAEQDLESKFYQRAARLVQQGATLEEVMEACELPRAEAELLYNLYKK